MRSKLRRSILVGTAGLVAIAVALRWLDADIARGFRWNIGLLNDLGHGLGSAVLITGELTVAAALVLARLVTGHLSDFNRSVVVAVLTSVSTYAANDTVLKFVFGMPPPSAFLAGAAHHFLFFAGTQNASFPSGHMALAMSFSAVMMTLHPWTARVLAPLLLLASTALVVGDWHFVSDVLAGALVGYAAGLLAAELYSQHYRR